MRDFDSYFSFRRYLDLALAPDGNEIAYVADTSGTFNVWRRRIDDDRPVQLTRFRDRAARRVAWHPAGESLVVAADRDGDENEQLFLIPEDGGAGRRLTHDDDVRWLLGRDPWSPGGRLLACACNRTDRADFELAALDVATGEVTELTRFGGYGSAFGWTPDGAALCGVLARSNAHQDVVLARRDGSDARVATQDRPPAQRHPVGFTGDGQGLYVLSDEGREHLGLARLDLEHGELDWIQTPEWDIELATVSRNRRWIAFSVNEDGCSRVRVLDRNSGIVRGVPEMPMGVCLALDVAGDGRSVAFVHSAARRPPAIVAVDPGAGVAYTLSDDADDAPADETFVEPAIVRFASHDRKVPGLLYRPEGDAPGGGFPALLWVHGGPEAQERPRYYPIFQYLLAKGIAILAPNIRGSTGYGKGYQKLVRRDFGGDDLKDLDAAARFLKSLGWIDGGRLAVGGASYGGFAALSCATRLPAHWAAAVDIVGPSNLVTFARSVPASWKRFMRDWVGDPDVESAELMQRSPITYVDDLRCPLLVIQGATDPRVVKAESDQMVARIEERGGDVEYLVFEDEGHGFLKKRNEHRAFRAVADFLEMHLAPGAR